jgi:hypothetical protein
VYRWHIYSTSCTYKYNIIYKIYNIYNILKSPLSLCPLSLCSCVVSTAPERVGNGWDQGLFFHPPIALTQGAHLTCHVELESAMEGQGSEQLRFQVVPAAGQGTQAQPAMGERLGKGEGRGGGLFMSEGKILRLRRKKRRVSEVKTVPHLMEMGSACVCLCMCHRRVLWGDGRGPSQ